MTDQLLTSKDNPLMKTLRLVSTGTRRAPEHLVIAEGIRVLEEVGKAGCEIEAVVFSEHFGTDPGEKRLLDQWHSRKIRVCKTTGSLYRSVSTVKTPQGALALVRVPTSALQHVPLDSSPLILYACGIQDPGNLGTLLRTAAAVGASIVCTARGTVSARSPKTIRSSAGAFFRLPVVEHVGASEFKRFCEAHSVRIYRTHTQEGFIYTEADLKSPCAVLLGNEGAGVYEKEFSGCPAIRIPMAHGVESLNVAIAGAVILFEAFRQRFNR